MHIFSNHNNNTSKHLVIVLSIITIVWWSDMNAQSYHYTKYGLEEGLPSLHVSSIEQDKNGYIWFGTPDGLCKFNGKTFQIFNKENGLPGSSIYDIKKDRGDDLWITTSGGLVKYNDANFTNYKNKNGLEQSTPFSFEIDNNGVLWVLGKGAMSSYDSNKDQFKTYYTDDKDEYINTALFNKEVAYLGTYKRILKFDGSKFTQVCEFDKRKDISALLNDQNKLYAFPRDLPVLEIQDSKAIASNDFLKLPFTTFNNMSFQDSTLMICHQLGLCFVNLYTFEISTYDLPEEANIKQITTHFLDKEGNIWLGSTEGIIKLTNSNFTFLTFDHNYPEANETYSFFEKDKTLHWGVNHGKTFQFKDSEISTWMEDIFPIAEVFCIHEYSKGGFWFGSGYEGMTYINDNTKYRFDESNGLIDTRIYWITEDENQTIWAGSDAGLIKINETENGFVVDTSFYKHDIINTATKEMYKTDKAIWVGADNGLWKIYNNKIVNIDIANVKNITGLDGNSKGNLWVLTRRNGIFIINMQTNKLVKTITSKTHNIADVYLDLEIDAFDNVWLGNFGGIDYLQKKDDAYNLVHFDKNEGFIDKSFVTLSFFERKDSTIIIGTTSGMLLINPKKLILNKIQAQTFISDVKLFEGEFEIEQYKRNGTNAKLELPYHKNFLSFEFETTSYGNPENIHYQYRLLGADDKWREIGKNNKTIFATLSPNNYQLEVKSTNNHGMWSEPRSYSFIIKPPFWQTMSFILFLIVLLAASIAGFFFNREKKLKKKTEETNRINQMIAELEVRALRAQMNPHFIFNCLNAIQDCIIKNETDKAFTYLTKFSRLLRKVLVSSEKSQIMLDDELDLLKNYIELEGLRFGNTFQYNFFIDEAIDTEEISIPSLMIQPFIENAIWHGLMHKEENRKLSIRFFEKENILICEVDDNGVGRIIAKKIKKERDKNNYESKGMKLISDRFDILRNQDPNIDIGIDVVDKKDNHNLTGTKVIIKLPINLIEE